MANNQSIQHKHPKQPSIRKNKASIGDSLLRELVEKWRELQPEELLLRHNLIRKPIQLGLLSCLKRLDLSDNPIGHEGASSVVELFEKLPLEYLDMSWTLLNDRGAVKFAPLLQTNNTLQILALAGNNIGPEAIRTIAESLQSNTTLVELNLEHNPIGNVGISCLLQLLEVNTTIQVIRLRGIKVFYDQCRRIMDLLRRNREKYSIEYWHPNNHYSFATYFNTKLILPIRSFDDSHCHKIVLTIFLCNSGFTIQVPSRILILILSFIQRNQFL